MPQQGVRVAYSVSTATSAAKSTLTAAPPPSPLASHRPETCLPAVGDRRATFAFYHDVYGGVGGIWLHVRLAVRARGRREVQTVGTARAGPFNSEPKPGRGGDFCTDVIMKWNDVTDISMGGEACACAPTPPRLLPDPEPDHLYDHHSSEEELEDVSPYELHKREVWCVWSDGPAVQVINGAPSGAGAGAEAGAGAGAAESRRRGASSPPPAAPEKRKWPAQPYLDPDTDDLAARAPSSDDDDTKVETPVRFRTSPPLEALKPRRAGAVCSCAGPGGGRAGAASARRCPRAVAACRCRRRAATVLHLISIRCNR
ncbi:unnamed protein product [Chrysodeixis includens]|uniref:Uncharacterized protein n=1 Tax=Chrysodeixis includens TaxID=689277 RepID=A0A9P0BLZ2_CHRIL|nr:unnamed protein product [Chrysodeixis includens]